MSEPDAESEKPPPAPASEAGAPEVPAPEPGPEPEPEAESEGDILATAEPFHPARDPDGNDDALPLPPPPDPDADIDAEPGPDLDEAPPRSAPGEGPAAEAEPPPAPSVEPQPAPARPATAGRLGRLLRGMALLLALVLVIGPVTTTLIYRFLPPPVTSLMLIRLAQGHGMDRRWRPLSQISPNLTRAVIGAEDSGFCSHHGFDFAAMQKAYAHNEKVGEKKGGGRIRGGSTISQQTAKNVFLWPGRTYVRKGLEAWFTVLIETLWGKRRIMEVYLNSIEWGPGVYGAEAAARSNFGVSAAALNPVQAARLAAILPRPLKWQADTPGRYVARRSARIGAAEGTVDRNGLDSCVE